MTLALRCDGSHVDGGWVLSCCVQTTLLADNPNPVGVLSSKATGEPSYSLAMSAHFAVKYAVESARSDAGISGTSFHFVLRLAEIVC
jgi:hypothetical protein